MLKTLTIMLVLALLSACGTPVRNASTIHTAISVQSDRRSIGTILDDGALYLRLYDAVSDEKAPALEGAHLNFLTYESKVLVTGEVAQQSHKTLISNLIAEHVPQILKVINEVQIAPTTSLISRAKDGLITTGVEALFYGQDVFHPAHVRVITENQTVYLMGQVTRREAREAVRTAKRVSGVQKIVKVFEYLADRPITEIKADRERELDAERQIQIDKQKQELEKQRAVVKAQERSIQNQIDQLTNSESGGTRF